MTDLPVAAPLAAALAAKGYESLTPVQQAVLAEELAGRDLLVSAQTGSGKTVAFGLAIAPELLSGDLAVAAAPRALVVAPTRELALQVRRELEWLYGEAGAQIASCVGGMDWRTERRALDRGAAIVVGTPGRLRDHIEKGSLDLSDLRAAVLDEADEMLDLGFEEDLKFILSAAPEERRTLMFSATVPKEIEALAGGYQRDSVRVQVKGEAKQHVDITYQAMNVALRDKENAVINLLLLQQARVAIVFAKTRAAVTHLHARMSNRGFKVVALSGELSQDERTRALQSLRDGRANVCIATDVAARGIDLPGLDLVVHFDLPANSETLLHRSGRTGRAGAKGTAVLIVAPADFRKSQRLLQGAKVVAAEISPPTADEVQAADDGRMLTSDTLMEAVSDDEADLVDAILGVASPEQVAAGFLRMWRAGRSAPEIVGALPPRESYEARPPRERTEFGPSVWFSLSVGHEGRAEARWLLPKLCDGAGITRNDIGAIRVQQTETFVQIAEGVAPKLGGSLELDNGIVATRLDGAPDLERPMRSAPARSKPAYKPFDRPQGVTRKPREEREGGAERRAYKPREEGDGERRVYKPRPLDGDAPARKPWAPREDGERKPYARRDEGDAPRKPWAKRDDGDAPRKPYARREDGDAPRKPYAKREDGDRKPWNPDAADAPRKPRWSADDKDQRAARPVASEARGPYVKREDGPRKPYAKRDDGDAPRKPFVRREDGDAPRKPYAKREDGDRKPVAKREDGPRRPFGAAADGPRKPRAKPEGGFDKPRAAFGKPRAAGAGAEDRPTRAAAPKPNFSDPSQSLRKPRAPLGKGPGKSGFKPKR